MRSAKPVASISPKTARSWIADEDADHDLDASEAQSSGKQEWRRLRAEYRELTGDLKAALRQKIDAPAEEKARVLEILRSALAAIRQK